MTNQKTKRISFWITTGLLSFGMLLGGSAQILRLKFNVDGIVHLGYPEYVLSILGIWKLLAVIIILLPKFLLVKEWAYAGMIFDLTGAAASRAAVGDGTSMVLAPLFIAVLVVVSWALRPEGRVLTSLPKSSLIFGSHGAQS